MMTNTVYYTASGATFSARVIRRHRDGTVTVECMFRLNEAGKPEGCYHGFKFRLDASDIRATA